MTEAADAYRSLLRFYNAVEHVSTISIEVDESDLDRDTTDRFCVQLLGYIEEFNPLFDMHLGKQRLKSCWLHVSNLLESLANEKGVLTASHMKALYVLTSATWFALCENEEARSVQEGELVTIQDFGELSRRLLNYKGSDYDDLLETVEGLIGGGE